MTIPICDPKQEYLALQGAIDAAVQGVFEAGHYILGPNVAAFEEEMAAYLGCQYAVGVNSGTDALHLALRSLDIGPGDEVITTPFTFIATTEAIGMVGAKPVFADIDPRTFNIDPNCIEDAVSPRTKAILPVHLYGQPCDMDAIMDIANRCGVPVIEDCAQAVGASYRGKQVGTFGTVGCFSFFPSKNLGCCGDGGLVVTNDVRTHERLEMLRRHGAKVKYHHSELGLNSRLDELQAAVLRVKLPHLEAWNDARRKLAHCYNQQLANVRGVVTPSELLPMDGDLRCVYHQYTVLVDNRRAMQEHLARSNVGSCVYYPIPLHLQEVHRALGYRQGDYSHSESVAERCLSLPIHGLLDQDQQQRVAECVGECLSGAWAEAQVA